MPFCTTLMLQSGTTIQKHINLPLCNGWNGGVVISLTSNANITVSQLDFKRDAGAAGILTRSISVPFTINGDLKYYYSLQQYESQVLITYTCADLVSLGIESRRGASPNGY